MRVKPIVSDLPCYVLHSEGINKTYDDRSCLILTVQSHNVPDSNFTLGDDKPVIPIAKQYECITPILSLIIQNDKLVFNYYRHNLVHGTRL